MTNVDLQTILTTWKGDAGSIVLYMVLLVLVRLLADPVRLRLSANARRVMVRRLARGHVR